MNNSLDIQVSNKKSGLVGSKRAQFDMNLLLDTPFHQRTTIVSTARAVGLSPSTLHNMVKRGQLKRVRNRVKPYLSEAHKNARVRWALGFIIPKTVRTLLQFRRLFNYVHTDEKLFKN